MQVETVTELEKCLYNKHLATSRSIKGKPFKIKKDFSDLIGTEKHKYLKKLATLFKKHPEISFEVFFEAPYRLYPDVEYFGLDYFSTMRAVKAYTTYKKTLFLQDPDSQVEHVKESIHFIAKFCIDNNIHVHQYPFHRSADLFTWMVHYKENKINVYSIMEFSGVLSAVQSLAEEVQKFFVSDFVEQFRSLYLQYNNSNKLRPYLKKALVVVSNFVDNQLTKANL
jgi:hypothetical protein